MSDLGFPHELIIEHEDVGWIGFGEPGDTSEAEVRPGDSTHRFEVNYVLRHPERCIDTEDGRTHESEGFCPVDEIIEAIGFAEAFGVDSKEGSRCVTRHVRAGGVYTVRAWCEKYSGPEGDDYETGLTVERKV